MSAHVLTESDHEFIREVGKRLKAIRLDLGLSTYEMGAIIHLYPQQISSYENGHNAPSLPTLGKIAKRLGMTVSEILEGV